MAPSFLKTSCIIGEWYRSHKARTNDENNTNETIHISLEVSVCSVKDLVLIERRTLKKKCFVSDHFVVRRFPSVFSLFYSVIRRHILRVLLTKYGKMAQ